MLAVDELVRFLLAKKRQTMRCDWLAVVNIMAAEWTDASFVDYTMLPHFTFALFTTAPNQILGTYAFAYEQSLMQQRRRHLLSPPSPPYCVVVCDTNVGQQLFANKCCPTTVGQHLLVVCLRLKCA